MSILLRLRYTRGSGPMEASVQLYWAAAATHLCRYRCNCGSLLLPAAEYLHGPACRATEGIYVAFGSLLQPADGHQQPAACAPAFHTSFNASALGGYACPLFARKFLADSAAAVLQQAPYLWPHQEQQAVD